MHTEFRLDLNHVTKVKRAGNFAVRPAIENKLGVLLRKSKKLWRYWWKLKIFRFHWRMCPHREQKQVDHRGYWSQIIHFIVPIKTSYKENVKFTDERWSHSRPRKGSMGWHRAPSLCHPQARFCKSILLFLKILPFSVGNQYISFMRHHR